MLNTALIKRRALIIACPNSPNGNLPGAKMDALNLTHFLTSYLGGEWQKNEISTLYNPSTSQVLKAIQTHFADADYTFIAYSGHGFINYVDNIQYIELNDKPVPIHYLNTNSNKQTVIIDSCRGFYHFIPDMLQGLSEEYSHASGATSTRYLFDYAISSTRPGRAVLYSTDIGQTAMDTNKGGIYTLSLLKVAHWFKSTDNNYQIMTIGQAHNMASNYIRLNFNEEQCPVTNNFNHGHHFPFAVKTF